MFAFRRGRRLSATCGLMHRSKMRDRVAIVHRADGSVKTLACTVVPCGGGTQRDVGTFRSFTITAAFAQKADFGTAAEAGSPASAWATLKALCGVNQGDVACFAH
jgi:hypothetical protein